MCKGLNSIPSTTKKERKKERNRKKKELVSLLEAAPVSSDSAKDRMSLYVNLGSIWNGCLSTYLHFTYFIYF
jgi:hypothetical protein